MKLIVQRTWSLESKSILNLTQLKRSEERVAIDFLNFYEDTYEIEEREEK